MTSTPKISRRPVPHACEDMPTCLASTITYSVAHFCVDLACAMLVMGFVVPAIMQGDASSLSGVSVASLAVVAYNMVAFTFQLPIGMLADRHDDNAMVAAWGCAVVIAAYLLPPVSPILAAVVAGVGNAMFHVGGGLDTINLSGTKRADLPGIFVSTGAMGLFLGLSWDKVGLALPELPIAVLSMSGVAIVAMRHLVRRRGTRVANQEPAPEFTGMPLPVRLVLVGMFVTVAIRSLLGFSVAFPWKSGLAEGLVCTAAIVLGKALGGVVGDRIGWRRTAMVSLPVAAVLFLASYGSMPVGLLAMFAFNMTMPLTLTVLADTFSHNRGAAFGVTTVALFLGGWKVGIPFLSTPVGISLMCLASFAAIMVGFSGYDRVLAGWRHTGRAWEQPVGTEEPTEADGTADNETDMTGITEGNEVTAELVAKADAAHKGDGGGEG